MALSSAARMVARACSSPTLYAKVSGMSPNGAQPTHNGGASNPVAPSRRRSSVILGMCCALSTITAAAIPAPSLRSAQRGVGFTSSPIPSMAQRTTSPASEIDRWIAKTADAFRCASGNEVTWLQRGEARDMRDDLRHRKDHVRRRTILLQPIVDPEAQAEAWGSGISSAVTMHGPIGQNVSRLLPRVHCPSPNCRSRAETSLTTV